MARSDQGGPKMLIRNLPRRSTVKKFLILWVSQAFSLFGSAVVEFALAWHLTIKTGSATVLATAMLVAFLPHIILGPFIGPLIDRWNRKKIMITSDLSIALVTVALIVLFLTGNIQTWHIYLAMVARAIGQSFHFPAMQASIPMIVPEKQLSRAAGLNQMLQGAVNVAGPPVGAVLMGLLPMHGMLAIDIATALIAVCALLPIAIARPATSVSIAKPSFKSDMTEVFHYVWKWKGLRALIVLSALITVFLVPVFTLLPVLVTSELGGDVIKLGWLNSAFGVGLIGGGLLLGAWSGFKQKIVTCLAGVIVAGIAAFGLGFTAEPIFYLGLAASFLAGIGLSFGQAPVMAMLQTLVAKDMQGRVFALFGSISSIMVPLGLAIAGPAADAVGIRTLFWVAGIAVVVIGCASFFVRSLMELESAPRKAAPVAYDLNKGLENVNANLVSANTN